MARLGWLPAVGAGAVLALLVGRVALAASPDPSAAVLVVQLEPGQALQLAGMASVVTSAFAFAIVFGLGLAVFFLAVIAVTGAWRG